MTAKVEWTRAAHGGSPRRPAWSTLGEVVVQRQRGRGANPHVLRVTVVGSNWLHIEDGDLVYGVGHYDPNAKMWLIEEDSIGKTSDLPRLRRRAAELYPKSTP